MRAKLLLSYRGAGYAGWQRQHNAVSVQAVLEAALADLLGAPVLAIGASRTDAGVHARGQVVHCDLPRPMAMSGLVHGTNFRLPEDVRVLAAEPAPADFHARFDACGKEYRYRLVCSEVLSPLDAVWAVAAPRRLDFAALSAATRELVGRHDFAAFALAGGVHQEANTIGTEREVFAAGWERSGHRLELRLRGDGFLRGMVRSLVGTLLEVARGRRDVEAFTKLLAGRPRSEAGPTAPPQGLCLEEVCYDPVAARAPLGVAPTVLL
jgi:tRNA pseudouridine38-40 synthase